MNKKIIFLLACMLVIIGTAVMAQRVVKVDPLTGTANVTIPVYTVNNGQASLPINLVYQATGIKPKDVEGTAGMGWQLQTGGQISRQVRGLPDDCTADNAGGSLLGWMSPSNTAATTISGFTIANNGSSCSNETSDLTYMNTNFPYNKDTEPDFFYVSAPGLSCQLVYDRTSAKFYPVDYQDIVITYVRNPATGNQPGQIVSFVITNNEGISYSFGGVTDEVAVPVRPVETVTQSASGGNPVYFSTNYKQYQHGVTYYNSWFLSSITDANGNSIQLIYTAYPARNSQDPVSLYANGMTKAILQYNIQQRVSPVGLQSISTLSANMGETQRLLFNWIPLIGNFQTGQTVINSITGMGRSFNFIYSADPYTPTGNTRDFLRVFSEGGCNSPVSYKFNYVGETHGLADQYSTSLPDSSSTSVDYWGYYAANTNSSLMPKVMINPLDGTHPQYAIYNPGAFTDIYSLSSNGNSRTADPANVMTGSLNKVTYLMGGSTNITYESNDYLDVPSNTVVKGGGIRVKQLVDSAGPGSANNIIRNYSYISPAGVSSGRPVSLPSYAFTIPYSGTLTGQSLWNTCTMLSAYDLSDEDHTVLYGYSRESQAGAGSTLYQYYIPATNWDNTATCAGCTSSDWAPTINYAAREDCSLTYGPVKNGPYAYPFIPNTNYDFERGLPQKITSYNDAGTAVSETDYTYQRSFAPSIITAFKSEDDPNGSLLVKGYGKYNVYYNTGELTATVIKKMYGTPVAGTAQSSTTTYTYGSTKHKLVTQQSVTNSDNSTITSHFSYVKDYTANAGATNVNIDALYNLQQRNINAPVESYQQVTHGATTLTTGASLTLFKSYTAGLVTNYLPAQQLKAVLPDGGSFTPFVINATAGTVSWDAHYFVTANIDAYDSRGNTVTVDDANRNIQTHIVDQDNGQVVASFKNANYNGIAFTDFDTQVAPPLSGFTMTGAGSYVPSGSHAGLAAGFASTQTASSGTLTKSAVATNYIFSIWINAVTPGTLTLTLSGISSHPVISYSGGWRYYELKIPAAALASSYTVSFTSSQNISIDDVLFYPDIAEAATVNYDPVTLFKVAETNTNGVSSYYKNDQWGRVLYTFDQDKNIVQRNTFIGPDGAALLANFTPAVIFNAPAYINTPVTFTAGDPDECINAQITTTWDFGDGSSPVIAGISTSPQHSYTTAGSYTVNVKATSPGWIGVRTASSPITVTAAPSAPVKISYQSNTASKGDISSVIFVANGVSKYNFTGGQLNTASVQPGVYTITVTISDGQQYNPATGGTGPGYAAVYLNGSCTSACSNFLIHNTYSFTVDLSSCTTLDFVVSQFTCPI